MTGQKLRTSNAHFSFNKQAWRRRRTYMKKSTMTQSHVSRPFRYVTVVVTFWPQCGQRIDAGSGPTAGYVTTAGSARTCRHQSACLLQCTLHIRILYISDQHV